MGNNRYRVFSVADWILERWWRVAYLIIGPDGFLKQEWRKLIDIRPNARFEKLVADHLQAYIKEGVMPPDDIAPAILNLADDFMAGREITMRAGDYIALQNHLRQAI